MAERRIAEKTGRGVICFISNYSWLDGLSFAGMRERFLEAFNVVRIDCLNGDKYKTGKVAPDGSPDPSIFSSREDPVGIQVGTGIATLVRKGDHEPAGEIGFRHLWGQAKREELTATAEVEPQTLYEAIEPILPLGLPFKQTKVSEKWFDWPSLPELLPVSFPGVKTSRDAFLIDIDLDRLKARLSDYFDPRLSHGEITRRYPSAMRSTARYDARGVRDALLARGGPTEHGFVRFAHRPFDNRWLYWEADTKLLDEKRTEYKSHVFDGNLWIEARQRQVRENHSRGTLLRHLGDNFGNGLSTFFPCWLNDHGLGGLGGVSRTRPNLSAAALEYLEATDATTEDLFHHVLVTLHDAAYREANAGALRMEWPRIPLPGWPDGANTKGSGGAGATGRTGRSAGERDAFRVSAARGRELARLLDPEADGPSNAPSRRASAPSWAMPRRRLTTPHSMST